MFISVQGYFYTKDERKALLSAHLFFFLIFEF
jgi:hypothetical protein